MTNNKTLSAEEMAALFRCKMAEVSGAIDRILADLARVTAERDSTERALYLAIETHSVDQRQIERLVKYYMEQARGPQKEGGEHER